MKREMKDSYSRIPEQLWMLLILAETFQWSVWDKECVDFKEVFPADQFSEKNPDFMKLVRILCDLNSYEMSEWQCSWAVNAFLRWDWREYWSLREKGEAATCEELLPFWENPMIHPDKRRVIVVGMLMCAVSGGVMGFLLCLLLVWLF